MLDHVGIPVSDFARSKVFYRQAFAPLGFDVVMEFGAEGGGHAGFGTKGKPQFWIGSGKPIQGQIHFAFVAKDRAAVRAFYDAALKAGAKDNGPPGLRPQ
jgi:catechol 2,3-dioxygenase-like lactoylglutathione lyase family enzyme